MEKGLQYGSSKGCMFCRELEVNISAMIMYSLWISKDNKIVNIEKRVCMLMYSAGEECLTRTDT